MIEVHFSIFSLQTEISFEVDGDWDVKGAPASKTHFKLLVGSSLHVHILHSESLMQSESNFLDQSIRIDVFIRYLDKHGPLVCVLGNLTTRWHRLVPVAIHDFKVNPISREDVLLAKIGKLRFKFLRDCQLYLLL